MSTPASRLVVVEHDPRRIWRRMAAVALAWLLSLAATFFFVRESVAPGFTQLSRELGSARAELGEARKEVDRLERLVAVHQRGQQVAERANQELQEAVRNHQEELAGLRNDLGFFQRLMEGSTEQAGIGVHSLTLRATDDSRAFQYGLTLSQNVKRNRQATGRVEFSIGGSAGGRNIRLGQKELGGEDSAPAFAFRYFQQIDGLWMLPAGFLPATVKVKVISESGGSVEREFPWNEVLKKENG